jgi:iron complex outermembrane recepter protein
MYLRTKYPMISNLNTHIILITLILVTTHPQQATAKNDDDDHDDYRYEEVLVTAAKRENDLQEIATSLRVLDAAVLTKMGADNFNDWYLSVPGLYATDRGPSDKRYIIRGIIGTGEPQVGLYYDEIPISGAGLNGEASNSGETQADMGLWDVERVEVLRGPQGTLYGQGAMSGVIRILFNQPKLNVWEGAVKVKTENTKDGDGSWGASGTINIPLVSNKLSLRFSGFLKDFGGYIDDITYNRDDVNDEQTESGRASILWQGSDDLSVITTVYYQNLETGSAFEYHPHVSKTDQYNQRHFVQTPVDDQLTMYSLTFNYEFDHASLVASASYIDREFLRIFDTSRFVFSMFGCDENDFPVCAPGTASYGDETVESTAAEIRLVSKNPGPIQWISGIYYQERENFRQGQVGFVDSTGALEFDASGTILNRLFARNNLGTTTAQAAFGEIDYALNEQWEATLGLRWFDNEKDDQQETVESIFGPPGVFRKQTISDDKFIPKVNVSYTPNEDTLLYVQAAEGFRPGGVNQPGGFGDDAPSYESDSLWNYEFGWKLLFPKRGLIVNGALYFIEWEDMQTQATDETGAFNFIVNAGQAQVYGLELDTQIRIDDRLQISGGFNYIDAQLTEDQPDAGDNTSAGFDGDQLPNAPEWTLNINLDYQIALGSNVNGVIHFDWTHVDKQVTTFPSDPGFVSLDEYESVNFRFNVENSNWTGSLYVNNLIDSRETISSSRTDLIIVATPQRPRTIGVSLEFRLGES